SPGWNLWIAMVSGLLAGVDAGVEGILRARDRVGVAELVDRDGALRQGRDELRRSFLVRLELREPPVAVRGRDPAVGERVVDDLLAACPDLRVTGLTAGLSVGLQLGELRRVDQGGARRNGRRGGGGCCLRE